MSAFALVVLCNKDIEFFEMIRKAVKDCWDDSIECTYARNEAKATQSLARSRLSLLIADRDIAADENTSPDPSDRRGLQLVERAASIDPDVTAVLLATHVDADTNRRVNRHQRCRAVSYDRLEEDLRETLQQLRKITPELGPAPPTFVVMSLHSERKWCEIKFFDAQGNFKNPSGDISLSEDSLERFTKWAKLITNKRAMDYDEWEFMLEENGMRLFETISKNPTVSAGLIEALSVNKLCDVTFCFHTDIRHYPIVYESMIREGRFCALEATFARRLRTTELRGYPLLWDDDTNDPLRCLVIEADVEGKFGEMELFPLTQIADECDEITKLDFRNVTNPIPRRRLDVTHLSTKQIPSEQFQVEVFRCLRDDGPWDIVHFAGHSAYIGAWPDGKGYIFFPPSSPGDDVKAVQVNAFAQLLDKVRLVFLSSCQSASEGIVFRLADRGIPAIVGYRWPIGDDVALQFAKDFYTEIIFNGLRLGPAFAVARRNLRQKFAQKPHWIAPMLVVQHSPDIENRLFARPRNVGRHTPQVAVLGTSNSVAA